MSRRSAREYALQVLYSREVNPESEPIMADPEKVSAKEEDYALLLVEAVKEHGDIDDRIRGHLQHWTLERLDPVDRNILRLAVAEYYYGGEPIDRKVVINEAVEIAKLFGGDNSYRFVNGVLNQALEPR